MEMFIAVHIYFKRKIWNDFYYSYFSACYDISITSIIKLPDSPMPKNQFAYIFPLSCSLTHVNNKWVSDPVLGLELWL